MHFFFTLLSLLTCFGTADAFAAARSKPRPAAFSISPEVIPIDAHCALPDDPRELYIDLIKRCVSNIIYEPRDEQAYNKRLVISWPRLAHTMLGRERLDNIHFCLTEILANHIPGDCIETGVWRGGACILMRAILKAYGDTTRKVWVADSFYGLPPPNVHKYPADRGIDLYKKRELSVSLETVKENFSHYGLLDEQVVFIKGWFSEALPLAPIEQLALLRLDGDLYESTMDALLHLYPKVSAGGFVIIDDYHALAACRQAVTTYRTMHGITAPIIEIDGKGVYWQVE